MRLIELYSGKPGLAFGGPMNLSIKDRMAVKDALKKKKKKRLGLKEALES